MIETVDELIEIYSLNKEIKDTDPLYRDYSKRVFDLYNNMWKYVFGHPIPKDTVKTGNANITEDKTVKNEIIENSTVENKVTEQPANTPEPIKQSVIKNSEEPEEKSAEIKTANPNVNNQLTEQKAHINIVQNAYANGSKVNDNDDEENTGSNGCSAINNVNINFAGDDCIEPPIEKTPKKKPLENKQPSNNNTEKTEEKPKAPTKFVLMKDDYVIYGPASTKEAVKFRHLPPGSKWFEYDPNKEYKFKLMNTNDRIKTLHFESENDYNLCFFIVASMIIATIIAVILGLIL